jgi:hypothetical protein
MARAANVANTALTATGVGHVWTESTPISTVDDHVSRRVVPGPE